MNLTDLERRKITRNLSVGFRVGRMLGISDRLNLQQLAECQDTFSNLGRVWDAGTDGV